MRNHEFEPERHLYKAMEETERQNEQGTRKCNRITRGRLQREETTTAVTGNF